MHRDELLTTVNRAYSAGKARLPISNRPVATFSTSMPTSLFSLATRRQTHFPCEWLIDPDIPLGQTGALVTNGDRNVAATEALRRGAG